METKAHLGMLGADRAGKYYPSLKVKTLARRLQFSEDLPRLTGPSALGEHFKDNQGSKSPSQVSLSRWTCDTKKCLIGMHRDLLWSPFLQGRTPPGPHAIIFF